MPGLSKYRLAGIVEGVLRACEANLVVEGFVGDKHDLPWQCEVAISEHIRKTFLFHFWTISHGGKSRAIDEYRIQAKLKSGRRLMLRGGIPVLLGYYSEDYDKVGKSLGNDPPKGMEVFAAWDPVQHFKVGSSSSCQVRFRTLYDAGLNGAAVTSRRLSDGSLEKIASFRIDRLPRYLQALQAGHQSVSLQALNGLA
jgi:hypothetical protein